MRTIDGRGALDWFSDRLAVTEFLSILSSFGLIYVELDNRKPPRQALADALARPLASYARWPRVLGLSVVVLVMLQLFTGALLALYYLPTPATAHDSTAVILRDVNFGWLVHQAHYWGAQLLILILFVRVVRYLAHGIFRSPRELEWLAALGLLAAAVVGDASGRLLLWSNDSYWLGVRIVETLIGLPVVGPLIGVLLGGEGTYLSAMTLIRVYGLHAVLAPTALLALIYIHFSTVRRLGLNEIPREAKVSGSALLRRHLTEVGIVIVVAVTVLITLAVLAPQLFPCAADPYATLPTIQLPWYLLAPASAFELTRGLIPASAVGGALVLIGLGALFVPMVARRAPEGRLRAIAAVLVAVWLLLTLYGMGSGR